MEPEMVVQIAQRAVEVTAVLMLILLTPALLVGVAVSILQAATQVNEATLSFMPKMLVTMVVLIVAGPLILRILTDYMRELIGSIPGLLS
jgi:flagellar biosynthesis protein FliQ